MKNKSHVLPLLFLFTTALSGPAWANPSGENVAAGAADFSRLGSELTVTQHTQNAIVNWQSFSIAAGEATRFLQPQGGAILNRVTGGEMSSIHGMLQATGQVFLLNPHGVVVGPSGVVNAAGGFTASTLDIHDADFLNGGDLAFAGTSLGPVQNLGTIRATGGDVVLLGQEVHNEGEISAGGDAVLAAGSALLLKPAGSSRVAVLAGSAAGTLHNSGLVEGANAELLANGGNAGALAINTTGIVRATGVEEKDGRLILSGGGGDVTIGGTLAATRGENGGDIIVTGERILVDENARIVADGADGGTVKLGGGREGLDPAIPNANRLYIAESARITADGTAGDGGEVIAYSTDGTQSYGTLSARGTQKGGFIETSGGWLDLGTRAPDVGGGLAGGLWLIDPYNIEIVAGGGNTNINGTTPFASTNTSAELGVDLILAGLASGDVTVQTGAGGAQAGDILLSTALDFNGIGTNRTLTLSAHRNVTLDYAIHDSAPGGDSLNLVLDADNDNNSLGAAILKADITTGGGNLISNRATYMAGASALAINTGAGNQTYTGQVQMANDNGVTLTTDGGTILFSSALDSGNIYSYDSTTRTWTNALAAVKSGTGADVGDTYLATITSALENSVAQSTLPGTSAWLGGSDVGTEGQWRWVAGPEGLEEGGAGRQFWQGAAGGSVVNGQYNNWNSNEPNDAGGNEDALQIGWGAAGEWNDYPANSSLLASIVETNLAPTNLTVNLGTGGVVTFNGAVGSDKQLGNLTIGSGGTVNINHNVTSAGTVDLDSAATFGSANRTLTANALVLRQQASGNVDGTAWLADTMDLQQDIDFTGRTLRLAQRTAGRVINLISAGAGVDLSGAELERITAQSLIIGNSASGNLTITDSMDLSGKITNLLLESGGTITDDLGAVLTTTGLGLRAGGAITLDNAHAVDTLAIHNTAANSSFRDTDGFAIGNFSGFAEGITATGRNVQLTAGGAVTQANAVVASGLELLGAGGAYTLTHASNNIATLAGNTGSVNYLDSNALAIGTVNTAGLTTTGATQVRTTSGDLTVDQDVTAGGGGNSLVLAAGQSFNNNRGTGALDAGSGGRFLIYSDNPGDTDLDGLTAMRYYNHTFAGNAPGTIGGSDNRVLYSYAPVLTFTAQNANHVYGNPVYTYTVTGYETLDNATTAFSGVPTLTPASTNVGTHTLAITGSGLTNLQGYTFNFVNGNVTITPAALTIAANSISRQFGHPNPVFTATFTGLTNGDGEDAVTGLTLTSAATANSPFGTYAITASGGTNANYTITHEDGTLTVTNNTVADKVREEMTTFSNVPTKQQDAQVQTVQPAAGPTGGTAGQNNGAGSRSFTMPQVGVLPAVVPQGNSGKAGAQGGGGTALAQTSTLDLIEEEGNR